MRARGGQLVLLHPLFPSLAKISLLFLFLLPNNPVAIVPGTEVGVQPNRPDEFERRPETEITELH
jgi:hypothetical protein